MQSAIHCHKCIVCSTDQCDIAMYAYMYEHVRIGFDRARDTASSCHPHIHQHTALKNVMLITPTAQLAPPSGTTRPEIRKKHAYNGNSKIGIMATCTPSPHVSSSHPPPAAATVAVAALTSSARSSCTHPLGIRLLAALMHSAAPGALKNGHNGLAAHCKHFDCAYLMSDDSGGGDGSG
jgi:hypothetical protein